MQLGAGLCRPGALGPTLAHQQPLGQAGQPPILRPACQEGPALRIPQEVSKAALGTCSEETKGADSGEAESPQKLLQRPSCHPHWQG